MVTGVWWPLSPVSRGHLNTVATFNTRTSLHLRPPRIQGGHCESRLLKLKVIFFSLSPCFGIVFCCCFPLFLYLYHILFFFFSLSLSVCLCLSLSLSLGLSLSLFLSLSLCLSLSLSVSLCFNKYIYIYIYIYHSHTLSLYIVPYRPGPRYLPTFYVVVWSNPFRTVSGYDFRVSATEGKGGGGGCLDRRHNIRGQFH